MVPRKKVDVIETLDAWLLIYRRRKTGKSFFIQNSIKFDEYYFISRSGRVYELVDNIFKPISNEVFFDRIQRSIYEDKTIVIDEFHRLSEEFQDLLHASKPRASAKVILITSSLFFAEKILRPRSPLLGIVIPVRIDIISPSDIIKTLAR